MSLAARGALWAGGYFAACVVALAVLVGCAGVRPTVDDAYRALVVACAAAALAPEPDPETIRLCAELRDVCVEPAELRAPPPAYGNKVVEVEQ